MTKQSAVCGLSQFLLIFFATLSLSLSLSLSPLSRCFAFYLLCWKQWVILKSGTCHYRVSFFADAGEFYKKYLRFLFPVNCINQCISFLSGRLALFKGVFTLTYVLLQFGSGVFWLLFPLFSLFKQNFVWRNLIFPHRCVVSLTSQDFFCSHSAFKLQLLSNAI